MQKEFILEVLTCKKISTIENAWKANDYKALLALMGLEEDFEGFKESELLEMCLMALNDCKPDEAARHVLTVLAKEELAEGKIDHISHSMAEEKLWEEYADLALHKRLFSAYGLLRRAFNGIFSEPTGITFQLKITPKEADGFEILDKSLEAVLVRLLSAGMGEDAILNRLYGEKIAGDSFDEAKEILWECKILSQSEKERVYEIISSEFWLGEMLEVDLYEAWAHADNLEDQEA